MTNWPPNLKVKLNQIALSCQLLVCYYAKTPLHLYCHHRKIP